MLTVLNHISVIAVCIVLFVLFASIGIRKLANKKEEKQKGKVVPFNQDYDEIENIYND